MRSAAGLSMHPTHPVQNGDQLGPVLFVRAVRAFNEHLRGRNLTIGREWFHDQVACHVKIEFAMKMFDRAHP